MSTTNLQKNSIKQTLKNSILDGACFSAMLGLTQSYIAPFALALRATTAQIGLLSSIPGLTMALSQFAVPRLAERASSRKRFILPVVLMHALMWVPILLIPYIFPGNKMWWLIGFITLSTVFSSLANPAWGSMMADLVPENKRGRYFSLRGRICDFVMLVVSFAAGGILQLTTGNPFLGFSVIFGGAVLARLASWYFISRMHEPSLTSTIKKRISLLNVIKKTRSSNLGRFMIYVALVNFATCLAGPFFAVYMLRDLNFSYLTYVAINATSTLATITFLTLWGKRADRAGNVKIMRITSYLIPLVPLLWLVSRQIYFLIPIQIIAGFAWSGFNLASSNFLYDASPRENRTQSIAIYNAVNGIAICLGALVGGFLAPRLPHLSGSNLLTIFLISGVVRMLVVISPLSKISEVRSVSKIGVPELLFGKPVLLWAGIKSKLVPAFLPVQQLKAITIPSNFLFPLTWSYQRARVSRSPPFFDDS
ncbi:MAG: MFS transporter [Dehalococcoidales bacterium]|nr:MAG: MFS transporter [Dehalococcoidales bacterium]